MTSHDTGGRAAPGAIVLGGLLMAALFVPFTLAHGPTSANAERTVLGWDMHAWGFLLGVLPGLLVASGLWWLRGRIAGGRPAATVFVVVIGVALVADALMNLAFRALGAPFVLFLLGPAIGALAVLMPGGAPRTRLAVVVLAVVLTVGLGLALVPPEISDAHGGFRVFGIVVYALGGLGWAALGLSLWRRPA